MNPILGAAAGQAMSMLAGKLGRANQYQQQEDFTDLQVAAQKELTDYNNEAQRKMQMQMWKETNLPAQVKMAKDAGMSISALLGGSGAGGATTGGGGQSGSVAAGTAEAPSAGANIGLQMASQLALMQAQKENIEADTANKRAGAGNQNVDTEGKGIDNVIKAKTKEDVIKYEAYKAQKEAHESQKSLNESRVGLETQDAQIKKIKAEAIGADIENEAKKQGIRVDKAQINKWATELTQKWEELKLQGNAQKITRENAELMAKTMLQAAGIHAAGSVVKSVADGLMKGGGGKPDKVMDFSEWLKTQ